MAPRSDLRPAVKAMTYTLIAGVFFWAGVASQATYRGTPDVRRIEVHPAQRTGLRLDYCPAARPHFRKG